MSGYFNDDQESWMENLASIPREKKCASGWHVLADEKCDCKPLAASTGDTPSEPPRSFCTTHGLYYSTRQGCPVCNLLPEALVSSSTPTDAQFCEKCGSRYFHLPTCPAKSLGVPDFEAGRFAMLTDDLESAVSDCEMGGEAEQAAVKVARANLDAAITEIRNQLREVTAERDMLTEKVADMEKIIFQGDTLALRQLAAAESSLSLARQERDAAREFVEWAMRDGSWMGGDIDGGDAQDKAEELGLIVEIPADEAFRAEYDCDTMYQIAWAASRLSSTDNQKVEREAKDGNR